MSVLTVNGKDLSGANYGFELVEPDGWLNSPSHSFAEATLIARPGSRVRSRRTDTATKKFAGKTTGSSNADAKTKIDNIKAELHRARPAPVTLSDFSGRQLNGELVGDVRSKPFNGMGDTATVFAVEWDMLIADPPYWEATSLTTVTAITNSDKDIAQGSARPHGMIIKVAGSATNPTITYKDSSGATITAMAFTVSLGASDWLVLDVDGRTAFENTTGNPNEGTRVGTYTGAWIDPQPSEWDYVPSDWPTLRSSTGTGQAIYSRCWV